MLCIIIIRVSKHVYLPVHLKKRQQVFMLKVKQRKPHPDLAKIRFHSLDITKDTIPEKPFTNRHQAKLTISL